MGIELGLDLVPGLISGDSHWWLLPDMASSNVIVVYQPTGATSLADSYVNLVAPGTHDAAPGTAPTWDAVNGWTFSSAQYLVTDIVPDSLLWSVFVRFSDSVAQIYSMFGETQTGGKSLYVQPTRADNVYYTYGGTTLVAPAMTGGVVGITGGSPTGSGWRDGIEDTTVIYTNAVPEYPLHIGGMNNAGTPVPNWAGKIQAMAIYNVPLTPSQVATLTARMAVLPF